MKDQFTSTGVLITPDVREMQIEFHVLSKKRKALVAGHAATAKAYSALRRSVWIGDPKFAPLQEKILAYRVAMTFVDNALGKLARTVEVAHVLAKDGVNARPGVATMGLPA